MSIEFRDLRWAIIASQHRSLREAAKVLNVRQSTLSRRLRSLEDDLGVMIFERTNGGTRPTGEGLGFIISAQHILEQAEEMTCRLRCRSRGESGRLVIGVQASMSAGNMRATLVEHQRRFPFVEAILVDGSGDHLIAELANQTIDLAFLVEGNRRWDGKSLSVWSERVVAALPQSHPLSNQDSIQWSDLESVPMLVPHRGPGLELQRLLAEKAGHFQDGNLRRHDVSLDRLLTLVGVGAGILLALEGATGINYPGVTFREVLEHDRPTRLSFRACWREENPNPSLTPFLDMVRERYPDFPELPTSQS